jgi:cold shock CspA family protein
MMLECFVETRESRFADASLEKIVRSVSASIAELSNSADNQLAHEIEQAVSSGYAETIVLVGNNGAGKSTFIERFFDSVLDFSVRDRCTVVRIDTLEATGDPERIADWLTGKIRDALERLIYGTDGPTYEELQGLYFGEYSRWMRGPFKPLYESDKTAFKVKFSEFLDKQLTGDPYTYILRLLEDAVRNRKQLPCIIFDNCDHFELRFQEAIFQYSQAVHKSVPFTLIIMAITDRSLWRLSKAGPFQTYPSKMFYLPVPSTKEVLEKRVAYLRRRVEDGRDQHQYFLKKGIRLSLENIQAFAACLEELFIREDFVARRISWLANNNVRRCLQLAQKIITSPFFSVEDLVSAYMARGSGHPVKLNYGKFTQALLQGSYNAFQQDQNQFVLNVFAISPYFPTSPLLNLSILKMLIDRAGEQSGVGSYMSVEQTRQYFVAMGVNEAALDNAIQVLLVARLVEPYDASQQSVDASQRIAITHSGRMHFELATTDQFYVGNMAYATPIRCADVVETLRRIRAHKMTGLDWAEVQKQFVTYCFGQDTLFALLPKDAMYEGQRQFRSELKRRWVDSKQDASAENSAQSSVTEATAGFSHTPAVVKWFSQEKGFGFADAGLDSDVFIHKNVLEQAEIQGIGQGDTVFCDIAPGPKGKLQAIAVHSLQRGRAQAFDHPVEGIVEFFDTTRGYGFVSVKSLPEDVFLSARTLELSRIGSVSSGDKVRMAIEPGRFGKGFMATSVERVFPPSASAKM